MRLINVKYFGEDHRFHEGSLLLKGGRIAEIHEDAADVSGQSGAVPAADGSEAENTAAGSETADASAGTSREETLDGRECYCIPGLIDLQLIGADGLVFADSDQDGCDRIAGKTLRDGVTAFTSLLKKEPVDTLLHRAAMADGFQAEQLRREGCKNCRSCESYQPDAVGFQPMAESLGGAPEFPREALDENLLKQVIREGNGNVIFPDRTALSADTPFAGGAENRGETLFQCMRERIRTGKAPEEAVPLFTEEPAKALRVFPWRGGIGIGKKADLLLIDAEWNLKLVMKDGESV